MPFYLRSGDITKEKYDCIVNAANRLLLAGGGVCGAIFQVAGYHELEEACSSLSPIQTGHCCITPGFHSKARYIIHAVGPIYQDGNHKEKELLFSCYRESLELAKKNHIESIAFPLISSGIYGYPYIEAYKIAKEAILSFLDENEDCLSVTLYLTKNRLAGLVKEDFVPLKEAPRNRMLYSFCLSSLAVPEITTEGKAFCELLFSYIDQKGMTDSQFYHKANMDRRLFSKLKQKDYHPSKNTILSCAIALELDLDETNKLLESAGYALSRSLLFDSILIYCIEKKEYDIFTINEILYFYDQPILGERFVPSQATK